MKSAKSILLSLTGFFIFFQIVFAYFVMQQGDGDVLGSMGIALFYLTLILLYTKKLTWAKWALAVFLVLYALVCLLVGLELGAEIFYGMALYYTFFGIYIHLSPILKATYDKQELKEMTTADQPEIVITSPESLIVEGAEYTYPRLVKRYKALLIDGLLLLTIMIIIMVLTNDLEYHTPIMITAWIIFGFGYEPLLTVYSKTIGQRMMGIAVRRHDAPTERINLLNAYIRIFIKGFLGWLSFITIHFNSEHRAIHDIAGDSVVIDDNAVTK